MKTTKWNSAGDVIRYLRSNNHTSQECLSIDCDIAVSTLERIENGKTNPRLDNFIIIIEQLGYRLEIVSKQKDEIRCIIEHEKL